MSAPHHRPTAESADNSLSADLQNAIDSAGGLFTAYQQIWSARYALAQKEWRLTKQSACMVLIVALVMSAVISSLWLLANIGIGSALYQSGVALWAISLILISVNIGLMIVLWQTLRHLLRNIGFSELINSLNGLKKEQQE